MISPTDSRAVEVIAPGRICLIGEHQDYLGLGVISGAMNLAVRLTARPIVEPTFRIELTSIGSTRRLDPARPAGTLEKRDYLQSGLNLMLSRGYSFGSGFHVVIGGDLPIGKGVSSSSALCTGWIALLAELASEGRHLEPLDIAKLAFESEVLMFGEPGGMQDHLASALGGLLHLDFRSGRGAPGVTRLPEPEPGFLLVDSGSTKETIGMIAGIRTDIETALLQVTGASTGPEQLRRLKVRDAYPPGRSERPGRRLIATLINRRLTGHTRALFQVSGGITPPRLGALMNSHHRVLRDLLESSSPAIDALCRKALERGALGAKVIGSGGGGCLLVYAPGSCGTVARQLSSEGIRCFPISISDGLKIRRISQ